MSRVLAALLLLAVASPAFADDKDKPKPNTLTAKEIAEGWILLFDGETTFGWQPRKPLAEGQQPQATVKDGILTLRGTELDFWNSGHWRECDFSAEYRVIGKAATFRIGIFARGDQDAMVGYALTRGEQGAWCALSGKFRQKNPSLVIDGTDQGKLGWGVGPNNRLGFGFTSPVGTDVHMELRSIKIRPVTTKSLFNGETLDGWKVNVADPKRMASKWEVTKDGELSVKNGPGDLVTEKQFDNFVLQLECKTNGKALNSGVFFRCIPGQYQNGYEAQIQNAYKDDDRTKPADFGTGAIYRRIAARKVVSNDNEWFKMTVVADGKHISTWVNGYQTVDWIDDRKENENPRQGYRAAKGPLSIQGHDPTTDILFRNIRIAELPK